MDQEKKIKEIEQHVLNVERLICKHSQILVAMDTSLSPLYLEWKESKRDENIVSRMFLE